MKHRTGRTQTTTIDRRQLPAIMLDAHQTAATAVRVKFHTDETVTVTLQCAEPMRHAKASEAAVEGGDSGSRSRRVLEASKRK